MLDRLKRAYKLPIIKRKLSASWQEFNRTGMTPPDAYRSLGQMFILTKVGYNNKIAESLVASIERTKKKL